MTKSMRALLMGAALTGFVAGTSAMAQEPQKAPDQAQPAPEAGKKASKAKVEKHCCKGQNSCKGQGGCGATKGKNECKGQGNCSTHKEGCAGKGPCKSSEEKKS